MSDFVGGFYDFHDIVGDLDNLETLGVGEFVVDGFLKHLHVWTPVGFADQEDWHDWHFLLNHNFEDVGKFIEGAEATWEEDEDLSRHSEHNFASEEVFKGETVGEVWVWELLVLQGDVEADSAAADFVGAEASSFHDARTTAGNDGVAILGKFAAEFAGEIVKLRILWGAGGAENRDALWEGADNFEAMTKVASISLRTFEIGNR